MTSGAQQSEARDMVSNLGKSLTEGVKIYIQKLLFSRPVAVEQESYFGLSSAPPSHAVHTFLVPGQFTAIPTAAYPHFQLLALCPPFN